ncbi:hypothetical protein JXA48_04055 [Candidatus Woesearchaeota archaeon]|nr:hypothetical protein [Candidatus Woesearchaeota archaeon]
MNIAICASMSFAKEMIEVKEKLEQKGHQITLPEGTEKFLEDPGREEDKWTKIEIDPFKEYFKVIGQNDAILVLNMNKKGIEGYVGSNTLIEIAFAHVQNKIIYLYNRIPEMNCADEIFAMKPIIINQDLDLIKGE